MQKSTHLGSSITLAILVHLIMLCIMVADLHANPYVKDLHKSCAKDQQKCALSCATTSVMEEEEEAGPEAMQCLTICNEEFDFCEKAVARFKEMNKVQPVTHRMDRATQTYKDRTADEHWMSKVLQGRVVVEDPDL